MKSETEPQWIALRPEGEAECHPLAAASWIGPASSEPFTLEKPLAAFGCQFELPADSTVTEAFLHFWVEGRPHNDPTFETPVLAREKAVWKAGFVNGSGEVPFRALSRLLETRCPQTVEIGPLLHPGENRVALLSWMSFVEPSIVALVEGRLSDGQRFAAPSDASWRVIPLSVEEAQRPDWHERCNEGVGATARCLFGSESWSDLRASLHQPQPPVLFRTTIELPSAAINSGMIESTAIGGYEMELNGRKVGSDVLAPGFTDTRKTIHLQRYEVADLLQPGTNHWTATVAPGWVGSWLQGCTSLRECVKAFRAKLTVRLIDGRVLSFATGTGSWEGATGTIRDSSIYGGETVDMTYQPVWRPVTRPMDPMGRLVKETCAQARPVKELPPVAIREVAEATWQVDFGRNFTGVVRLTLNEPKGQRIELVHAEALRRDGRLMRANLRAAACLDRVICPGGPFQFQPRFTFRGFRYVEIRGLSRAPEPSEIRAVVISSLQRATLELDFATEQLNRLMELIRWTQLSNWLSIPMDCPQRSERLGWMGDNELFAASGLHLFDGRAFQSKHLDDIFDAAHPNGSLPDFVPCGGGAGPTASYGWGDAGVVIPHRIYRIYGDLEPARKHWKGIRAYLAHRDAAADADGLNVTGSYGDWLTIETKTPHAIMGPIFHAYTHRLAAELATALGETAAAVEHLDRFEAIGEVWRARHLNADGRIESDTQGVYLCAWDCGLIPEGQRPAVARALRKTFSRHDDHLRTGILSTARALDVLVDAGFRDLAWHLLEDTSFPSYGYFLEKGATTLPEWWDPWPDGNEVTEHWKFHDLDREAGEFPGSLNHPVFGAVAEGIIRHVWGLQQIPGTAGYTQVRIAPAFTDKLERSSGRFASVAGDYELEWKRESGGVRFTVRVPPGCSATVAALREGDAMIELAPGRHEVLLAT